MAGFEVTTEVWILAIYLLRCIQNGKTCEDNQAFHKADIIKAYIAFLSGLDNIENQKIIDDKMDELIAEKVLDSDITVQSFGIY